MAGDYNATVYDTSTAEKVVDRLIYAESMTLPVMILSRVLECKDSHLLSALRALEGAGTIATSGSSRRHPGLPAMVRLRSAPSFGRAKAAAARMRQPPPKRKRGKINRTPQKTIAPVDVPEPTEDQTGAAIALFRNIMDGCSRTKRAPLPVLVLLYMEGGRYVTVSGVINALGLSRGHISRMMTRLGKVGVVTPPTCEQTPRRRLTPLGRAVCARARVYHEAWVCPLSPSATATLRIIARIGTATSTDIARGRNRSQTTANTALRNLEKAGLIHVVKGTGRGSHYLCYALTQKGRSILVCL